MKQIARSLLWLALFEGMLWTRDGAVAFAIATLAALVSAWNVVEAWRVVGR